MPTDDRNDDGGAPVRRWINILFNYVIKIGAIITAVATIGTTIAYIYVHWPPNVEGDGIFERISSFGQKFLTKLGNGIVILSITSSVGLLLSIIYQSKYSRTKTKLHEERQLHKRSLNTIKIHQDNNKDFLYLAELNADCDKKLFDTFLRQLLPDDAPREPFSQSLNTVSSNIEAVIRYAVILYSRLTGGACAVCVKIIDFDESSRQVTLGDIRIRTLVRDEISRKNRAQHDNKLEPISNNTADEVIFTEENNHFPNQIYAKNDLIAEFKAGRYHNGRKGWENDYISTIVCAIHNLHDGAVLPWIGTFCVDNLVGNLDNETSKYYAKELACRLSVMLYRQDLLRQREIMAPPSNSLRGYHAS